VTDQIIGLAAAAPVGSESLRLGTQLAIGGALLLAVAGGAVTYHQYRIDGEAAAAVRRGTSAVPVEVSPAELGTIRERIEAVGSTLARQAVDIVPLSSGRVAEIAFRPGEHVAQGAVLVRLDDEAEQAAVAEAQATLREAELALERARKLRTNNTVAQATVDELQAAYLGASARLDAARKELTDRTVRAPFAGVVGIRGVDIGARVDDETVLTTLDDLVEIEIEFSVPEIFFGRVRPDQLVQATTTAYPGRTFAGSIASIDSRIGQVSRAFRVRAVLPNPDLELPAGMFMHVSVVLEERPAVLIPEQAVLAEGDSTYVFTVADGRALRRKIRLGQREAGTVEVLDGLVAFETVVRTGLQRLRDNAEVQVLNDPDVQPGAEGQGG
jgi:membrane fusion protein, multidrug efflux system